MTDKNRDSSNYIVGDNLEHSDCCWLICNLELDKKTTKKHKLDQAC